MLMGYIFPYLLSSVYEYLSWWQVSEYQNKSAKKKFFIHLFFSLLTQYAVYANNYWQDLKLQIWPIFPKPLPIKDFDRFSDLIFISFSRVNKIKMVNYLANKYRIISIILVETVTNSPFIPIIKKTESKALQSRIQKAADFDSQRITAKRRSTPNFHPDYLPILPSWSIPALLARMI